MDYKQCFIFIIWLKIYIILIPLTSTFNFDSATSCDPKISRKGRAQLLATIPCDLKQQAYCNLPGPSYPWHAVRRFVHENQGLMKRMYGDVRHISILRNEIQNNEIDMEDIEATAARYSRNGNRRRAKLLQSNYHNRRTNDVLTEPHFRPATTTTTSPTTTKTSATSNTTTPPASPATDTFTTASNHNETSMINPTMAETDPDNNIESNSILDTSTSNPGIDNIKVVPSPNLSQNKSESATISTTLRVVQQIIKSETETEQSIIKDTLPEAEILQTTGERIEPSTTAASKEPIISLKNNMNNNNSTKTKQADSDPSLLIEGINKVNENFMTKKKRPSSSESQLFQDTMHKDTVQVGNARGVNACPVKEEVVAPFWANNTRGEILALLNLYPFEQYVHWEKCTHEHKQMYCREGCRCEQQYRLHRLLAYDPHNECRGIFSDWFRFPSCCICKCYDIPLEFRSTSRSPRTAFQDQDTQKQHLNPIDLAQDEVQRAIYEHATEEWYRPRDEFDLYDD